MGILPKRLIWWWLGRRRLSNLSISISRMMDQTRKLPRRMWGWLSLTKHRLWKMSRKMIDFYTLRGNQSLSISKGWSQICWDRLEGLRIKPCELSDNLRESDLSISKEKVMISRRPLEATIKSTKRLLNVGVISTKTREPWNLFIQSQKLHFQRLNNLALQKRMPRRSMIVWWEVSWQIMRSRRWLEKDRISLGNSPRRSRSDNSCWRWWMLIKEPTNTCPMPTTSHF